VFARMIPAPSSSSAPCVSPLTVAAVPTGMNAGVSNAPCGVVSVPRRAPVGSVSETSNENFTPQVYRTPRPVLAAGPCRGAVRLQQAGTAAPQLARALKTSRCAFPEVAGRLPNPRKLHFTRPPKPPWPTPTPPTARTRSQNSPPASLSSDSPPKSQWPPVPDTR
jgi:hypothetical protein